MGGRRVRYAKALGFENISVFDIREDRSKEFEDEFSVCKVDTLDEFESLDLEIIFVCVPPAFHLFYLKMAVAKGWHFMVEQPISHTMDGLGEIASIVKKKKLISHVSANKSFHPAIEAIEIIVTRQRNRDNYISNR